MFELKTILLEDEPSLRKKSKEVKQPYSSEDKATAKYLHEYLKFSCIDENIEKYHVRAGVGLAAPQIGINKRIISIYIVDRDENQQVIGAMEYALINPKIISHSVRQAYLLGGEGCLSVEKPHEGIVPRFANITVKGYDVLSEQDCTIRCRGYEAIVLQHEIDHLDGILFFDRINKKNPNQRIEGALEI